MKFFILICVVAIALADNTNGEDLDVVTRRDWNGLRPKHTPTSLEVLPPSHVIVIHTASGQCLTEDKCIHHVRNIQDLHVKQYGLNDISFNFLVGGDGNIYEGRGWDVEGSHTKSYNQKSLGVAFIGDFTYKSPTQVQVDAAKKLLDYGLANGKLAKGYKLLGQRQVTATQSPGNKVYDIIKTWDHWTENP